MPRYGTTGRTDYSDASGSWWLSSLWGVRRGSTREDSLLMNKQLDASGMEEVSIFMHFLDMIWWTCCRMLVCLTSSCGVAFGKGGRELENLQKLIKCVSQSVPKIRGQAKLDAPLDQYQPTWWRFFSRVFTGKRGKTSLISWFCSRTYGESIFQMSSLLITPQATCSIWDTLRNCR